MAEAFPTVPGLQLDRVVGRGSASVVYAAVRVGPARGPGGPRVAVRVTDPRINSPDAVLAAAARHEDVQVHVSGAHVVRLHQTLVLPGGVVALVLDLVDGGTLVELVTRRGPLDPGELVTVLTPLATVLAELHAVGIAHGNLAPGQVLFTPDGRPVLAHLDAARRVTELSPSPGRRTPGFVAPEILAGEATSTASDVWSLGAVAWFAATGTSVPTDAAEQATSVLGEAIGGVVGRLLAADPESRPGAMETAEAFYGAVSPTPVRLPARDAGSQLASSLRGGAGQEPGVGGRAAARSSRTPARRWFSTRVAVLCVGVVLLAGVAVGVLVHRPLTMTDTATAQVTATTPSASSATTGSRPSASANGALNDPVAVLQALVDARASALAARDTAALAASEVSTGPLAVRDAAVIASLTRAGRTYEDLHFTVRSAVVTSSAPGVLVLVAVVDRGAYVVLGPGSATAATAAQAGTPYTYRLSDSGQGWRLLSVGPG